MQDKILFEEKQFIGYNKWAILWRTVLALFCFMLYFWSENPKPIAVSVINTELFKTPPSYVGEDSGQLFFLMGVIIMLLSLILIFVLHLHTKVINNNLILDGLWTSRKVKIDLSGIIEAKKVKYSVYLLNPPIYNLHFKGVIRFFTQGNDAVELTDKDGLKYLIGSQKAEELAVLIKKLIVENKA